VKALGKKSTSELGWKLTIDIVKVWLETGKIEDDSIYIDLTAEQSNEENEIDFDDTASVYNMPRTEHGAKSYAKWKDQDNGPPILHKEFKLPELMRRIPTEERCESIIMRLESIMRYLINYSTSITETTTSAMSGLKIVNTNLFSTLGVMVEIGLAHLYYRKGIKSAEVLFREWTDFTTSLFMIGDGTQAYRGFIDLALQKACSIGLKCHTLAILCKKLRTLKQKRSNLLVPSLALLISQSTRQSLLSTDDNSVNNNSYNEIFVVKGFYASFIKHDCNIKIDQDAEALWNTDDEGFPLGCIVARHLPIYWRLSTAMLWLSAKAPYHLGGVEGRENCDDDFHGVSRISISSFIGRIITHVAYHWKYNDEDKTMSIFDDLPIKSQLHYNLRKFIYEALIWFKIYQPDFWRSISTTNITCDGSEVVAGDLELGPLGMCSVLYASKLMEISHQVETDKISSFPLLASPISSHNKVLILLRNLQALSIFTIAKIEDRCYAADHISMDQMVNATVILTTSLKPYFEDIKQKGSLLFGLYDLHINLIKFIAQLCCIIAELQDEERLNLEWHKEQFWIEKVYPNCIKSLATLFQLIKEDDKRSMITRILALKSEPQLQSLRRQSVFLSILEENASMSNTIDIFKTNVPKFMITDDNID